MEKKWRENDSFVCLVWKTFSITLKTIFNDESGLGPVSSNTEPIEMMTCVHF